MKKRKAVMISQETHKRLKEFCLRNGLLIENFVDTLIDVKLLELKSK